MDHEMDRKLNDKILLLIKKVRPDLEWVGDKNSELSDELDSFDIIILVTEIETEFRIKIPGEQIRPENFRSMESICSLILDLQK